MSEYQSKCSEFHNMPEAPFWERRRHDVLCAGLKGGMSYMTACAAAHEAYGRQLAEALARDAQRGLSQPKETA